VNFFKRAPAKTEEEEEEEEEEALYVRINEPGSIVLKNLLHLSISFIDP